MQTDYQNINFFEVLVTVTAIVGLGLIGVIVYAQLPINQQDHIVKSLSMFNLRDETVAANSQLASLARGEIFFENFMNQFYIAFSQVAVVQPEDFQVPQEILTTAYNSIMNSHEQTGKVLGAWTEARPGDVDQFLAQEQLIFSNSYQPPNLELFKRNLKSFALIIN